MEGFTGIVKSRNCFIYEKPGDVSGKNRSEITDELLSGWAAALISGPESAEGSFPWIRIRTHYGYEGYADSRCFQNISPDSLREREESGRLVRITQRTADVLAEPKVQARLLETLLRDSFAELVKTEEETGEEGWCLLRTAAGRTGYVHAPFIAPRTDSDGYLLQKEPDVSWFSHYAETVIGKSPEEELRENICRSALSYMDTQYRWAGKSSAGIDCSGLAFMSYMENGILIFRDAHMVPGFPVKEIPRERLKKGDLVFFPGHVALYLGNEKYVHATGCCSTPYVTVNCLDPGAEDCRQDLCDTVNACGSIF